MQDYALYIQSFVTLLGERGGEGEEREGKGRGRERA